MSHRDDALMEAARRVDAYVRVFKYTPTENGTKWRLLAARYSVHHLDAEGTGIHNNILAFLDVLTILEIGV